MMLGFLGRMAEWFGGARAKAIRDLDEEARLRMRQAVYRRRADNILLGLERLRRAQRARTADQDRGSSRRKD